MTQILYDSNVVLFLKVENRYIIDKRIHLNVMTLLTFSVISTYREPVVGWVDNVYGPTGALVGGGAGLVRTLNVDENCTAELVPADLVVNALIATAWDVAYNK